MTPAINHLKKAKIEFHIHEYEHDPECSTYGKEAAEKLKIPFEQLFKTLVVSFDINDKKRLAVALVPVSRHLDLKAFAKAVGSKKAKMADKKDVERSTGYILGGVSPVGQKNQLTTIIDESALGFDTIFISGGRRGLQIEITPHDLGMHTKAVFKQISI